MPHTANARNFASDASPNDVANFEINELLYLSEPYLIENIELLFFVYRNMTQQVDALLAQHNYGRAHHRCLHFVNRLPGISVKQLLKILLVSKQSLNRVVQTLCSDEILEIKRYHEDKRMHCLYLTSKGQNLIEKLLSQQTAWMQSAFKTLGPEKVKCFRTVLGALIDKPSLRAYKLINGNAKKTGQS